MIGIYKITNNCTGQSYIGQSIDIAKRWQQHIKNNKKANRPLHDDIKAYGKENFTFEIIEECSKEELNEKEIYWIAFYNTYKGFGYNQNSGGGNSEQCINKTKKKIYCYSLNGQFIQEYDSISDAARQTNIENGLICRAANTQGRTKEFQWRYEFTKEIPPYKRKTNPIYNHTSTSKPVLQLTLEGIVINEFPSIQEASRQTGISNSGIGMVCNGQRKSAGKYKWKFKDR